MGSAVGRRIRIGAAGGFGHKGHHRLPALSCGRSPPCMARTLTAPRPADHPHGPANSYADKLIRIAHGLRRSEEHTSELQSLMRISYAVFCLKKKKKQQIKTDTDRQKDIRHTHTLSTQIE